MTLEIDFLPFATGTGAGVEAQATWAADTALTNGFVVGLAQSIQVNKAIRQPSFVAAAISNFIANIIHQNVLDNGILTNYWSQFWQSLLQSTSFIDSGSTNAIVITPADGLTFPAPIQGLQVCLEIASTNNGPTTIDWMGNGSLSVTYPNKAQLNGGELVAGGYSSFVFDGTEWQLIEYSPNASQSKSYASRAVTIEANYSIIAGDGGKNILAGATNLVVTASSSFLTSGDGPVVIAAGNGPVTIASSGSASFTGGSYISRTSITIPYGGWIAFEPDGSNFRIVAGDPTTTGAPGGFAITGNLTVGGTGNFTGQVSIPAGTAASSAVNLSQLSASQIPGVVTAFAGASLPSGYLWCNGAAYSTTSHPALFAALGYTYGGSGTTFNVPDLRGRVPAGVDAMGGAAAASRLTSVSLVSSNATLGASGGNQYLQSHYHTIYDPGHTHTVYDPGHAHSIYDQGHNHYLNDPSHTHATYPANVVGGPGQAYNSNINTGSYLPLWEMPLTIEPAYTGVYNSPSGTGIGIYPAYTAISNYGAVTGITINPIGAGGSQNVQPTLVLNFIIYAG